MMALDRSEPSSWYATAQSGTAIHLNRPDGSLFAICGNKNGILDGVTTTLYPSKDLEIYATYVNDRRHGIVRTWNEEGKVEYWCQYLKGKRSGFCCAFKDGDLQLVLQCDRGKTTGVHLISRTTISKTFEDEDAASADEEAVARLEELQAIEERLLKTEQKVRKDVKKQIHDEEQKLRHQRASSLNVQKRNDISNRAAEHTNETQAVIDSLRRASGF